MNQKYIVLITLLIALSVTIRAQDDDKSKNILEKARRELKIPNSSDIKTLRIKRGTKYFQKLDGLESTSVVSSVFESGNGKTRIESSVAQQSGSFLDSIEIINGNERFYDTKIVKDGEKMNVILNSGLTKEQEISRSQRKTWEMLFPLFLQSDLFGTPYNELKFKYVGLADSGSQKATVLTTEINKSTYTYFFDTESNRLLMVIKTTETNDGKKVETKYYYSDYREESGFIFPHKVEYRTGDNSGGGGEIVIEKLELNPEINSSRFKV